MALGAGALPIDRVLHTTDLSGGSELAFVHALKIAVAARAALTILHADRSGDGAPRWDDFPGVRDTLERWGELPGNSGRDAVGALGLRVEKIQTHGVRPLAAIEPYVAERPPQLLVLATHGANGSGRWLRRRVAEPLARRARAMTLFLRHGGRGFVDPESGAVSLDRVLVAAAAAPAAQPAVDAAAALARGFGVEKTRFGLLHAGAVNGAGDLDLPQQPGAGDLDLPQQPGADWQTLPAGGRRLARALRRAAAEFEPDLIVMTTRGHDGLRDRLLGSTTERLVRHAPCPVLAIPAS